MNPEEYETCISCKTVLLVDGRNTDIVMDSFSLCYCPNKDCVRYLLFVREAES